MTIIEVLMMLALVAGINLGFRDFQSRSKYPNRSEQKEQADSVLFHRYDSVVMTMKKK